VRNRIVNTEVQKAIKSNPAPLYHKDFVKRISTGNLEDDISEVNTADWIIEVVVERLDIKKQVFEYLDKHRTPGTLITSNTSGIPIKFMSESRSDDFQKHFCGTHRSEEHTSELQSRENLVCRLLLEKKKAGQPGSPGGVKNPDQRCTRPAGARIGSRVARRAGPRTARAPSGRPRNSPELHTADARTR